MTNTVVTADAPERVRNVRSWHRDLTSASQQAEGVLSRYQIATDCLHVRPMACAVNSAYLALPGQKLRASRVGRRQ
jgi:hypothetical protein